MSSASTQGRTSTASPSRQEIDRVQCAASASATDQQRCARSVVITPVTTMIESTKTIATMMDSVVGNDAAEAIGIATEELGSVITSIAVKKLLKVLVPRMRTHKCRVSHACKRNVWARVSMEKDGPRGGKGRARGERAHLFARST